MSTPVDDETLEDPEVEELRAQARFERAYIRRLVAAPDCRDPEHPGCPQCEDGNEAAR